MPRQRVHNITDAPARRPRVIQGRATDTTQTKSSATPRAASTGKRSIRQSRNTQLSDYNPAKAGTNAGTGVGALEAEFLAAIALLVMLMFANSGESYSNRIMSLMKRGTLVCVLFFVLALVSTSGPTAAKIAKGFGLLVIVSILLTSPITTVLSDLDNLIKNDWVGSDPLAGGTNSADTGTASGNSGAITKAEQDLKAALGESNSQLQQVTGLNQSQLGVVGQLQHFLSGLLP